MNKYQDGEKSIELKKITLILISFEFLSISGMSGNHFRLVTFNAPLARRSGEAEIS
jgi:hypothetical protein